MSLEFWIREPGEVVPTEYTSYFLEDQLDVTANAEEGSVAISTVQADDSGSTFSVNGLRVVAIKETRSPEPNSFIYVGFAGARTVSRGPVRSIDQFHYRDGTARTWDIEVVDPNSLIGRRVMTGNDCNRPAESDIARITWLLATTESAAIQDSRYVNPAGAVDMDATDYRGMYFSQILDDCAQQSGKNYFITYFGDLANTNSPWGLFSLWYDFHDSTAYRSTIKLSNVLAEVDDSTTFAYILEETTLRRDPSRTFSGVWVQADIPGGHVYAQKTATANNYGRRDFVAPAMTVKSTTRATARANRYLKDLGVEEDIITTSFVVPADKVQLLREGMAVQFKGTHLPTYQDAYVWLRCLNRSITTLGPDYYKVKVELAATDQTTGTSSCENPIPAGFYGPNLSATSSATGNIYYKNPAVSDLTEATPYAVGAWNFPLYNSGGVDYAGDCAQNHLYVFCVGPGTITVHTTTYTAARTLDAVLEHQDESQVWQTDDSTSVTTGTDIVFTVPDDGICVHRVNVTDDGSACGNKWGFTGADWSPS